MDGKMDKEGKWLSEKMSFLKGETIGEKIEGINCFPQLAAFLGPVKTTEILIPLIVSIVDEDEALIESFSKIIEDIPEIFDSEDFNANYVCKIGNLCFSDNNLIRSRSVKSILKILDKSGKAGNESFAQQILFVYDKNDAPIIKIAMCEMAPKLHRKIVKFQIDSVKIDVYDIFSFCCQHDDSSVRKHSILTIDGFLDELKEYDDFVSKFEKLLFDSCDLVQMAAIEVFRDILAILMNTQNAEKWSEFAKIKIESLIKSDSWRIRRKVCDNFCRWTRLLSNFDIKNFVIKSFLDFSDDAENEVVFSAASNIVNFAKFVDDKQVEKEFLGAFKNIVAIGHKDTLIAAVANLSALLKLVSADFSKNDCEEIFQTILNLEDEISIVFIMNLDKLENFSLIEDFATKLNTKFLDLLKNPNWRIRMKAAQYLCEFLKILELENFDEKFFREVESLLVDKIYRVRKEIGVGITKIYEEISPEKFNAIFWNRIVDLTNSKNYLHRSSALFILKSLCKVMDKDQVLTLLPVLDKMRKDKVPNIRMHSAICYKRIAERFKDVATTVELALEELRKDSETDVVNAMSFD